MIFPANFSKFEDVEKLEGKTVRVTGKVTEYQKRPQAVRDAKEQLKVQDIPDGPGHVLRSAGRHFGFDATGRMNDS